MSKDGPIPPKARDVDPCNIQVPRYVETPRLLLSPPVIEDCNALTEARSESYDDLYRWFHEVMGTREQEADTEWQRRLLRQNIDRHHRREHLYYHIWHQRALIGVVDLQPLWRRGQIKLGYWLRKAAWGRGFAAEAVNAVARMAFSVLDARLVTTGHAEPNVRSATLIKRLGFAQFARQPLACEMPDGTLVPGVAYAIQDIKALPPLEVICGTE